MKKRLSLHNHETQKLNNSPIIKDDVKFQQKQNDESYYSYGIEEDFSPPKHLKSEDDSELKDLEYDEEAQDELEEDDEYDNEDDYLVSNNLGNIIPNNQRKLIQNRVGLGQLSNYDQKGDSSVSLEQLYMQEYERMHQYRKSYGNSHQHRYELDLPNQNNLNYQDYPSNQQQTNQYVEMQSSYMQHQTSKNHGFGQYSQSFKLESAERHALKEELMNEDLVEFNIELEQSPKQRNIEQSRGEEILSNGLSLGQNQGLIQHHPLAFSNSEVRRSDDELYQGVIVNHAHQRKKFLRYILLGFASIAVFPQFNKGPMYFCMFFAITEIPRIFVPFIIKQFTFNLYQRQAVLVLGFMVFLSHLVVYIGIMTQRSWLTFSGRALFGMFSAGLLFVAVLVGGHQYFDLNHQRTISTTFTVGISLSAWNMVPLFICFVLDKILNKLEDEDFGILTFVQHFYNPKILVIPFVVSIAFSIPVYFQTQRHGHRLKTCIFIQINQDSVVAFGAVFQLASFAFLLIIQYYYYHELYKSSTTQSRFKVDQDESSLDVLLIVFLIGMGITHTFKIAIFPQVMPFVIKEEVRLESGAAFNQAIDHLITSTSLVIVGLLENSLGDNSKLPIFMYLLLLTLTSNFFYWWFYIFDKYKKNSLLDLRQLGQSGYVKHVNRSNNSTNKIFGLQMPILGGANKKKNKSDPEETFFNPHRRVNFQADSQPNDKLLGYELQASKVNLVNGPKSILRQSQEKFELQQLKPFQRSVEYQVNEIMNELNLAVKSGNPSPKNQSNPKS
ncbi:UNKNOWN [Stylonychia lemnae]|uniref:Uncharacterized protein n=1 Tax=Stylonychia lemnae TaxID=5949 RepID=A0A078B4K3_STYLE|nr:UNKNOWN [Stylonychia lemnae]|eukprot:CDW89201.1 UNKNOWN [Stylonychia lemnae]